MLLEGVVQGADWFASKRRTLAQGGTLSDTGLLVNNKEGIMLKRKNESGFTLLEVAMVLIVASLIVLALTLQRNLFNLIYSLLYSPM